MLRDLLLGLFGRRELAELLGKVRALCKQGADGRGERLQQPVEVLGLDSLLAGGTCGHVVQREHTEIALDLFRAVGNQVGVANSYNNLAWCLTELGDYERAVTLCKQAFELFEDFPDRKSEANTWDTLGYASRHLGHHEEAVACYRRALELHRQINSRVPEAHAYRKIGDIRYDRGAFDEARVEWRRAMDIFSELGLPGGVKEIRERLARLDGH